MSKLDPASGSLENILASIRKSLSEQSTDALGDPADALVESDQDAKSQPKHGLTQRLAGTTPEIMSDPAARASDDLSDLLEGSPGHAAPAAGSQAKPTAAPPPAQAPAEQDPLWFLTRRDEPPAAPAPKADVPPPAAKPGPAAGTEPKLTRPEVLRASMPPFFGSSTDMAKPPSVSASTQPAANAQSAAAAAPPAPAPPPVVDAAPAREPSPAAAAADAPTARLPQPAVEPLSGDKAGAATEPQTSTAATHQPHTHALEAMVLDLLKPMLRQWLDENMPRLVAEALSGEVQRARGTEGGVKKT